MVLLPLSLALRVNVIVLAVGVAVPDENLKQVPVPAVLVIVAVTAAAVLNANPDGAFKMNVPLAGKSRYAPSRIEGPVSVVYPSPAVSADIAEPPVAGVTVTAADATP